MDPAIIGLIAIAVMMACVLLGVPVGYTLALTALGGMWLITGNFNAAKDLVGSTAYRAGMEYIFGTVPLFILMGTFANLSGISREIFDSAGVVFSRLRGGLGITTVIANAVFAAVTGASVASATIFTKIAVPQMTRLGYEKRFALGLVGSSSLLGMLIPPSILFIIFGLLTREAIGALFIAGIIPGLMVAGALVIQIIILIRLRPNLVGGHAAALELEFKDKKRGLGVVLKPWPVGLLAALVLGGLYGGYFTPTEAGAIGASGAFILVVFKRRFTLSGFWGCLLETGYAMAALFILFLCAQMFSRMLTLSGLTFLLSDYAQSADIPPLMIIGLFCVLFLVLGIFMDSVSILLVTIPIMMPIVQAFGFPLIWFGVVAVVAIEIGLITPPFGMVVFSMKASMTDETTVEEIFRGCVLFLVPLLIVLVLLVLFPSLTTWLPEILV